jgi:hypothetical protein
LKIFLTQIRPALPLTPDPPVICFWKWIRWKDYEVPKNCNLESVSAKNEILFSPRPCIPAHLYLRRAHTFFPLGGDRPTLLSPSATRPPAAPPPTALPLPAAAAVPEPWTRHSLRSPSISLLFSLSLHGPAALHAPIAAPLRTQLLILPLASGTSAPVHAGHICCCPPTTRQPSLTTLPAPDSRPSSWCRCCSPRRRSSSLRVLGLAGPASSARAVPTPAFSPRALARCRVAGSGVRTCSSSALVATG